MSGGWIILIIATLSIGIFCFKKNKEFAKKLEMFEYRTQSALYCTQEELMNAAENNDPNLSCILPRLDEAAYATNGPQRATAFCFFDDYYLNPDEIATCNKFKNTF